MASPQRRGSLTTEGPALSSQRRASVPQGAGGGGGGTPIQPGLLRRGSKLTFLGAGRRVSMMLKYRQALQSGRGKEAVREEEETEEANPMEPIRELPHSPRFSTFLSPEAQYAMMKGYEDKLFHRIADSKPEVRSSLQRTKTPFQKICVVDQDHTRHPKEEDEEEEGLEEVEEEGGRGQSTEVKSTLSSYSSGYGTLPASTQTRTRTLSVSTDVMRSLDNDNHHRHHQGSLSPESTTTTTTNTPTPTPPTTTITMPYLKPLRRQSVAGTSPADINGNGMSTMTTTRMMMMTPSSSPLAMSMSPPLESSLDNLHLQRSHSLPSLDPAGGGGLSMSKRLVLTYRLESAMDLLDSLKKSDPISEEVEEHSLSPRVLRGLSRLQQAGDPVKDFNSWTKVWNKEFKEVQSK